MKMKRLKTGQHWKWCRQSQLNLDRCPCQDITEEMPFVRAEWLIQSDLKALPRMQDLPSDAFLSPTEMDYCYFVSHRWLREDHPDPTGRQIAVALPSIWIDPAHRTMGLGHDHPKRTGVWYDFLCMPQPPRNRSEETRFRSLLAQHTGLTLCTIPILVVDREVDYATRAWCVAELLGVHRSGFSGKSVSLAMHALRYPTVVCHGKAAWDADIDIDNGFRLGLEKLQSWLAMNRVVVHESSDETKEDWQRHKDCMHAANNVFWDFCVAKQKGYEFRDDALLLAIAHRNSLECTYSDDVLLCMRIMVDVLQAFDE